MEKKVCKDGRVMLRWKTKDDIETSNIIIKEWFKDNTNCNFVRAYIKTMSNRNHVYVDGVCECGNKFTKRFNDFKRQTNKVCNVCLGRDFHSYADVVDFVENKITSMKLKVISDEYLGYDSELIVMDEYGYKYGTTYHNLIGMNRRNLGMEIATVNNRFSIENIRRYLELNTDGYELISNEWKGSNSKMEFRCDKGHNYFATWNALKNSNQRCPHCYNENRPKGELHARWKGGVTKLTTALRSNIYDWKKKSMELCEYKCVFTGERFDNIHHLISFNSIVKECLDELKMPLKDNLGEYSEEYRNTLVELVKEKHNKYGLGLCMCKELHKKFHDEYSYEYFTVDDFKEFIENYFNGKYDDELDDRLKSINSSMSLEEVKKLASFLLCLKLKKR